MRLKELRTEKKITQKDFAAILGVPSNTYNQWENGRREPDCESLSKIADYFGVTIDYLIGHETATFSESANVQRPINSVTPAKYDLLDEIDKAKVDAYIEGLLAADKYSRQKKQA